LGRIEQILQQSLSDPAAAMPGIDGQIEHVQLIEDEPADGVTDHQLIDQGHDAAGMRGAQVAEKTLPRPGIGKTIPLDPADSVEMIGLHGLQTAGFGGVFDQEEPLFRLFISASEART
jgi:hypothetical protein